MADGELISVVAFSAIAERFGWQPILAGTQARS
jgi:hypothetical protein